MFRCSRGANIKRGGKLALRQIEITQQFRAMAEEESRLT